MSRGYWYEHQAVCPGPNSQHAVNCCKCAQADEPKVGDVPISGSFPKVHSAWTCCCSLLTVDPWRPFSGKETQLRILGGEGNITYMKMMPVDREVPDALQEDVCQLFFDEKLGTLDGSVNWVRRSIREGTEVGIELDALTGTGKTAYVIMVGPDLLEYVQTQMEKEAGILKDITPARTERAARRTGKGSLPEDP